MADETVGVLRVVLTASTAEFGQALSGAEVKLKDFARVTGQAEQPLLSLSGVMQGAVAGAAAAVTARLLTAGAALATFGAESLARGNQMEVLASSFERLAGGAEQATSTLNNLRRGALGLVDDMSLMQSGNKAMLLGLNLTSEQMGELARTATVLGRAMGQDATKSLDDLIVALGRSSPLILDNLGLSVKLGEAHEQYAASIGKTVSQLTEAEKKQAFMNAAMDAARIKVQQLGEVNLTAADHVGRLWTSIRNLADAAGHAAITNGVLVSQLKQLADGAAAWSTLLREGPTAALREYAGVTDLSIPKTKDLAHASDEASKGLIGVALSEDELFKAMEGTSQELERATQRMRQHTEAARDAQPVLETFTGLQSRSISETAALTQQLERWAHVNSAVLAPSIEQVNAVIEAQEPLMAEQMLIWSEFPGTVQQSTTTAGSGIAGFFKNIFGGAEELGDNLTRLFQAAFTGGGGALGAVKAFSTQALSALLGMIPGIGQFVSAFAGPIIAMLSNLGKRFADFFRGIFGGPSRGELIDRNLVAEFEDQLIAGSEAAQRESERWRAVVVALTEQYLEVGLSAEQAAQDAERLWRSSQEGGEETWRVIDEIRRRMEQQGESAVDAGQETELIIDRIRRTLGQLPREIDIEINYRTPDLPRLPEGADAYRQSSASTMAAPIMSALSGAGILGASTAVTNNSVNVLPLLMPGGGMSASQIGQEAARYLGDRGLASDMHGVATAVEKVVKNLLLGGRLG